MLIGEEIVLDDFYEKMKAPKSSLERIFQGFIVYRHPNYYIPIKYVSSISSVNNFSDILLAASLDLRIN